MEASQRKLNDAQELLDAYLNRTGVTGPADKRGRRYLWTDAFAVQTCLALARPLDAPEYHGHARARSMPFMPISAAIAPTIPRAAHLAALIFSI
jgi:hypothetical protein